MPIEEYQGANISILHKCKIHNINSKTTPSNALKGIGCKKCGKGKISSILKKEESIYLEQLKEANPNITMIGNYLGADIPTLFSCCICNNIWEERPQSYIPPNAFGCKKCADKINSINKSLGLDEYKNRVSTIYNGNIIVIDDYYINNSTPLKHLCLICKNEWMPIPSNVLKGHGCPFCVTYSKLEDITEQILTLQSIKYIIHKKFNDLLGVGFRSLSYDFYLPDYNLLIECQGKQHEQPINYFGGEERFKIQQEHDKRKREYAEQNNINLLEIWYYDINNIESILLQKIEEIKENNLKSKSVETVIPV